jgi:hypothetical protein
LDRILKGKRKERVEKVMNTDKLENGTERKR